VFRWRIEEAPPFARDRATGVPANSSSRLRQVDRKSYFLFRHAKNYQITQYDKPSTISGWVDFEFFRDPRAAVCGLGAGIWRRTWARNFISTGTAAIRFQPRRPGRSWKLFPNRTDERDMAYDT